MGFWRSVPGAIALTLLIAVAVALAAVGVSVQRATHPPRTSGAAENLGAELAKVKDVSFRASDGVDLKGWLLEGEPGRPAIVLAHDLGESKNALINLAIVLNGAGFTVLDFDFRGHGDSGGDGSMLGLLEARDVLGAVDYVATLAADGVDVRTVGAYGTGMGALAVVLAAADRPSMRVLVLDGMWPDPRWGLVHRTLDGWPFAERHLGFLSSMMFVVLEGSSISGHEGGQVLARMTGRSVLLVAPAGDGRLDRAMKGMYDGLPERRDFERSFLTLPATESTGLSADDLARYHQHIVQYFSLRLGRP